MKWHGVANHHLKDWDEANILDDYRIENRVTWTDLPVIVSVINYLNVFTGHKRR